MLSLDVLAELDIETLDKLTRVSPFRGPQRYFHIKTIQRRDFFCLPSKASDDNLFVEHLYATLSAWGIGARGNRLIEFDEFNAQIRQAGGNLDPLGNKRIEELSQSQVSAVSETLWEVISNLSIVVRSKDGSPTKAKIVAGSKTIHHLLPDLMPPMDNGYTGEFILGSGIGQRGKGTFIRLFSSFADLSKKLEPKANSLVDRNSFNSSIPKLLDNVIVGSVELSKRTTGG